MISTLKAGILVLTTLLFSGFLPNDAIETSEAHYSQQVYLVKQFNANIEKMAVFCEMSKHGDIGNRLKRLQVQFQIEFFLYDITSLPDIAKYSKDATSNKKVDAIWVFADELLIDDKTQTYLVKHSVNTKTFLLSTDPSLIKKGGTASVRIADSKVYLYLNQKAIDVLGITIPQAIYDAAEIIFF